jgi:hypothetical protein
VDGCACGRPAGASTVPVAGENGGRDGRGERPSGPWLPSAGFAHAFSVAQPIARGAGPGVHPNGFAFWPLGAAGPDLFGGIFWVTTASVATRRNSSVDCIGMARTPWATLVGVPW